MPKDDISPEERNDEWGKGCAKDGKRCFDCGDCVVDDAACACGEDNCEECNPPQRVQSPHKVIYLQYDPDACDEITWCQDQIDPKDTIYWRDDAVRELSSAILTTHKGRGHCNDCEYVERGEDYQKCKGGEFDCCKCPACKLAREVLNHKPE